MWIKTKAPRARLPLAIALLLAWWLACWLATGAWFDDEAQEAYQTGRLYAERFVADAIPGYNRIIRTRSGVMRVLARDPDIRRTLARFGAAPPPPPTDEEERRQRWSADPELAQINRFLDVSARELGLDALVLLDANGDCVAASNAGSEKSIVGASYGDRDDFQSARAGRSGYLATMGKKMGSTGLTFYAPVIDHGHFIGAVSGGNALAPFANLIDQADAFLSDRNGVVVLARDPSLLLHALPGAPVGRLDAAARQALYQRTELPTLVLTPWGNARYPELLRVEGRVAPNLLRSHSAADGGLTLSVLWPMPQLATLAQQRLVYAGALGTIGTLLMLLATAYLTRRREQRTTALALAQREQQATQARNFLDQVVNAIADPIFVKDREHRWVLVNQAFSELLGQPRENFIGKSDPDVLPEREARIRWNTDERVLTANIENVSEEKLTDSQGVTHIVVTKKAPYTDAAGQRFIVGIISDISERKQVERLLRAREQEFRTLAENSPDPIYRYDRDCRRLYVNPVVGRILGQSVESLIGSSPADGAIPISEQNRKLMDAIRRVFDSGETGQIDLNYVIRDGAHHDYDMLLVPECDADGQVATVLAIARDITERKQTQRQLKLINFALDHVGESMYLTDEHACFLQVNTEACRALGYSREELIGMTVFDINPDFRPEHWQAHWQTITTIRSRTMESRHRARDGRIFPVEINSNYFEFEGRGYNLSMARDITERKQAEDSLRENRKSLNEAQRVSHVGSWELDLVGNVLIWSDEVFRIFEIDPQQFGASYEAFFNAIHPDDREAVNRAYAESLEKRAPYEIEHRLLMADGRIKHVHERGETHYAEDGKPLRSLGTVQDITERKLLEAELTDSHNFLGKVVNSITDPVFVKDREHRWVLMNEAFCAMVGQPREVLLGKSDYDFLPKEQADVFWEKDELVFESGETNVNEEVITGDDGALRYIQTKKTSFMSGDGQVLLVGVIRDITDRRRIEVALQENFDRITELNIHLEKRALELKASREQLELTEAWYRGILQSAPDGMLVIDRHGVIMQVNAQLEIMFGYEGRELIGNRVEMLLPAAIRDAHVGQRIDFVDSGRTDRPMAAARHLRGCRKDGSEFPVDISLSQLPDIAGRVGVLCAAIRDITERKRMEDALHAREQEFRALIENSPDAVFRYDLDCRRIYVNPTVERMAGIPAATLLGKTPIEGLIDDINLGEKQLTCIQQVLSTGAPTEIELAWVHADGAPQRFHMHFVPEYGRDGQVTSVLAVGRDISARKLAEERLRKSHDILRALAAHQETEHEKERQELAYQIHEDLAQNLAALRLNISLFEISGESAPHAPLLKTMHDIADRSITRIRDIVSVLRPTVLDLGLVPALNWLTDDFKGVGFQFDLALPEYILLNDEVSTFLFRAAQEALINSALHAAATHVHLSLDTVADVCRLVVRDNGCGFDPAAPHREGRFGLIRLTEQARHLGGYLCIDSRPDQGTMLEFHVPAFPKNRSPFSK